MKNYYLRIEAVNLDYSIYDTHDISTIRGGSYLLHEAFEDISIENGNIEDIGSTASVCLLKLQLQDKIDTHSTASAIVENIRNKMPFATFVYAAQAIDASKSFSEQLQSLIYECRRKQYQSSTFVLPNDKKSDTYCDFDGIRPATFEVIKADENKMVSESVKIRQDQGKNLRNNLFFKLTSKDKIVDQNTIDLQSPFVNNLEELSKHPSVKKYDGKIAFIYIDGNRFGKIRDKLCTNEESYKNFQQKIQNELRIPAFKEIIKFAQDPNNVSLLTESINGKKAFRLETLLWGGDEIEWIVPAWQALNVLNIFFSTSAKHDAIDNINLTHSAGVVYSHHNVPVLQIRNYARRICDHAKTLVPTDPASISRSDNKIAFLNMTSFDMISGDVIEFLNKYYSPVAAKELIVNSEILPALINHLPTIAKILPRNKFYYILHAIKRNEIQQIDPILDRVYSTIGNKQNALKNALSILSVNNPDRWLLINELLDYSGE